MSNVRHAVVLAAGRGKRMGDKTLTTPKPMLEVRGKPMLEHVLESLAAAGIDRFLLVVGYRREMILDYFASWRFPIEFRVQDPIDGTGTAARLAETFTGPAPFILTFGDILCEPEVYLRCAEVLDAHPDTQAVLGVRYVDDPWQGAAVYESGGRIRRVVEKPPKGASTTRWNSGGVFLLRPSIYPYLARLRPSIRNEYELTSAFELMLADGLELRIAPIEGDWRDVGRPEDLAQVNLAPQAPDDGNQNQSADNE